MSYFTTNRASVSNLNVQRTFVDVLYDHAGFLDTNNGLLGPAGSLDGASVCVVGAGMAGLVSAYLLAKQGASVTVYEASDRVGGRVQSFYPVPGDAAVFEMGAMRVPPSEQLFNYYANQFEVVAGGQFPDPGKVTTSIIFQNKTYPWPAGTSAPKIFDNVTAGWDALAGYWAKNVGEYLADATTFATAQQNWQKLIYSDTAPGPEQAYSSISFFQGLVQAFVENASTWGTTPWTAEDFSLFGALGLGSGGFGPLYQVNFAEIARLVVNGLETDQKFYPGGLDMLANGFAETIMSNIQFCTKVVGITGAGGPVSVTSRVGSGDPTITSFDAVIIATTTRSMEVDIGITSAETWLPPAPVGTAIRELHLMNSSKLFVLTKSKFWGTNLPQNIQTDGLCRGLYCLDYPDSDYGVVLISYTWGDDSTKYIAIQDAAERLEVLLESLTPGVPDFVAALRPEILPQYTTMVDWQLEEQYYGAFKLNYPGQDPRNQDTYYQFLDAGSTGVYLAGDSVGWSAGWIESALQTGVNAAAGVANQIAGSAGLFDGSPMTQNPTQYQYGP